MWRSAAQETVNDADARHVVTHSSQRPQKGWSVVEHPGRGQRSAGRGTLREPPKSRQATASLMRSEPKICGAMRFWIRLITLGRDAYSLNSASS